MFLKRIFLLLMFAAAASVSAQTVAGDGLSKTMNNEKKLPAGTIVDIETTMGPIEVLLYDDTPRHRDNFVKLAKEGFYDGVLFHRVIKDFMIQTGDPNSKKAADDEMLGAGDPGYTIEAEILYPKHFHKYGALAAARTGDEVNPERRSSGSQFYIVTGKKYNEPTLQAMNERKVGSQRQQYFYNLSTQYRDSIVSMQQKGDKEGLEALRRDLIEKTEAAVKAEPLPAEIIEEYTTNGGTPHLDGQYTVFGEVVKGMDTVEKIQNVATKSTDRPVEDVRVLSVRVKDPTE